MTIPPWSYTMISDFANCQYKAYRKWVLKDLPKEEKSPEQTHGITMHKGFENWINKGLVAEAVKPYAHFVNPMLQAGAVAELKLGINADGSPEVFFGRPWGRGVADVVIQRGSVAVLYDWKTGKEREDPRELATQAMLLKAHRPELTKVIGSYVWLKDNRLGQRHDVSNFERTYNGTKATVDMMRECDASGHWRKQENPLCGWCPVMDCENNRSNQ